MKKIKMHILIVGILTLLTFLTACGGGGGSSDLGGNSTATDDNNAGSGDTSVTSMSSGVIEGFGSIIVNGVEFETEGAEVEIENEDTVACSPSASDDCGLHVGMRVVLENAFDDLGNPSTVTRIRYADNLEGPIGAFSESPEGLVKTLIIMGQTVILQDGVIRFDDADAGFDDFGDVGPSSIGSWVEVSGHVDFDGAIRATWIERKALSATPGDLFEVQGIVSDLDTAAATFAVNELTVVYAGVVVRNGTLADGRLVEVKGETLTGDTLQATDVEIKPGGLDIDDAAKVHLEGYLSTVDPVAATFEINGQAVDYSGAAFIGGLETELAAGVKMEVEGPVAGGMLIAARVVFKDGVRFEANVAAVNAAAGTLTLDRLAGISIQSDGLTVLDGFGRLADLEAGNNLKIRGRRAASAGSVFIASQIELIDTAPDDRVIIQGPVDGFVVFNSVDILGVTVDTTAIHNDDFKDRDTIIGEAEFFSRIANGDLVKARLDLDTDAWDQIEFEN